LLPEAMVSVLVKVLVAVNVVKILRSSARRAVTVTAPAVAGNVRLTFASPARLVVEVAELKVPPVVLQLMIIPAALTPLSCANATKGNGKVVLVAAVCALPDDTDKVRVTAAVTVMVKISLGSELNVSLVEALTV
jgi:hypothetical protein